MRIAGDALHELGIDTGDLVLVDRAITPAHGHVVIAIGSDVGRQASDIGHRVNMLSAAAAVQ